MKKAKKKIVKKYTDASDDRYDSKHKIKEGSKKDRALDKKRGVPEDDSKKIKRVKKKVSTNKIPSMPRMGNGNPFSTAGVKTSNGKKSQ